MRSRASAARLEIEGTVDLLSKAQLAFSLHSYVLQPLSFGSNIDRQHAEAMMPIDRDESPVTSDDDDDADGCLCGMEHLDEEATSDLELPSASGGIEADRDAQPADDETDVDGCELDFTESDQTTDAELPVTAGGT